MGEASEALDFERAASRRDQLRAVERTMESQKMAAFARTEEDVLGLARAGAEAAVQLFVVRDGRMVGRDVFLMVNGADTGDDEVLAAFIEQYYARSRSVPPLILLPATPAGSAALVGMLEGLRGRRVELRVPRRGPKRELVALARRNAGEALAREQARRQADEGHALAALEELADVLGLAGPPARIECYDISTVQGSDSVGSLVTFQDGRPYQAGYRRFRVRTVEGSDDYASHREVLRRRFVRARSFDDEAEALRWRLPDLVVIDGGRGQVSAAKGVLEQLGLHDLPLAGLAKEREELFLPDAADPIVLPATSPALYLLQRLRDEAHRFALGYHRSLRRDRQTRSALDGIPGIGPARRRSLLRAFGSVKGLRAAAVADVAAVPGIGPELAARIVEALQS
jgi:excinuclease ABC subunit C